MILLFLKSWYVLYYIDYLVNYSIFVVGLSYTIQLVSKNDSNNVFQWFIRYNCWCDFINGNSQGKMSALWLTGLSFNSLEDNCIQFNLHWAESTYNFKIGGSNCSILFFFWSFFRLLPLVLGSMFYGSWKIGIISK